jgi:hypothetical protein
VHSASFTAVFRHLGMNIEPLFREHNDPQRARQSLDSAFHPAGLKCTHFVNPAPAICLIGLARRHDRYSLTACRLPMRLKKPCTLPGGAKATMHCGACAFAKSLPNNFELIRSILFRIEVFDSCDAAASHSGPASRRIRSSSANRSDTLA